MIYIALLRPSLNGQLTFKKLLLFRNGITWYVIQNISSYCSKYFRYSSRRSFYQWKEKFLFNWYYSFVNADTFCANLLKVTLLHGYFHIFKIEKMVPNHVKRLIL